MNIWFQSMLTFIKNSTCGCLLGLLNTFIWGYTPVFLNPDLIASGVIVAVYAGTRTRKISLWISSGQTGAYLHASIAPGTQP